MRNLLQKKLDKKGFTLAELLIVVAIIAVLVAIAIPLFGGALDRAEEAAFLANQRSIKAAGVASMVSDATFKLDPDTTYYASATVTNGDISDVTVTSSVPTTPDDGALTWDEWKANNKTGTIFAKIETTDLDTKVDG